jgi:hypothetical protein
MCPGDVAQRSSFLPPEQEIQLQIPAGNKFVEENLALQCKTDNLICLEICIDEKREMNYFKNLVSN